MGDGDARNHGIALGVTAFPPVSIARPFSPSPSSFSIVFSPAAARRVALPRTRAGLSSRNPLNAACRTLPSDVNPANSISATSLGSTQLISRARGGLTPAETARSCASAASTPSAATGAFSRIEAGADVAGIGRTWPPSIVADQERTQLVLRPPHQPPITTSCPPRHFDFHPEIAAPRHIRRLQPLGHDAFEAHLGRPIAACSPDVGEMLDVMDACRSARALVRQLLQTFLARRKRLVAQIVAFEEQQIEDDRRSAQRSCRSTARAAARRNRARPFRPARKSRRRSMQSGKRAASRTISGKRSLQSSPLRVRNAALAALDAQLHSIAIELDFVHPAAPAGGSLTSRASCRRDELRHRPFFQRRLGAACGRACVASRARRFPAEHFFFAPRGAFDLCRALAELVALRLECQTRRALVGGDLLQRAAASLPRSLRPRARRARRGRASSSFSLMSSQLCRTLRARPRGLVLQPDQRPFALHALAVQHDLQLPLGEVAFRVVALRAQVPRSQAEPCRRRIRRRGSRLRRCRNRWDDLPPRPPGVWSPDRARALLSPPSFCRRRRVRAGNRNADASRRGAG